MYFMVFSPWESGVQSPVCSVVVRPARKSTSGRNFLPQFPRALLKEWAFGSLFGEGQGPLVRFAGLGLSAQPPTKVGAGRVGQVVFGQVAVAQDVVDQIEPRLGTVAHRHG